jgi:hypothetical protein
VARLAVDVVRIIMIVVAVPRPTHVADCFVVEPEEGEEPMDGQDESVPEEHQFVRLQDTTLQNVQ